MSFLDTNSKNRARFTGQAGVYRVAAECLLRGLNPQFPAVDCGADLIVDGGVRLQVKSGHLRYNANVYPEGAYWFKFWRGQSLSGTKNLRQRPQRVFSEECDFVVLHGIEQLRYWVVPACVIDGCSLVTVGPESAWVDANIEAINELQKAGLTQDQIAAKLGLTQMTVSRRLRGFYVTPKRAVVHAVRECEGKWQSVIDFARSMTESPSTNLHSDTVEESGKMNCL